MRNPFAKLRNDPERHGEFAAPGHVFGPLNRYSIRPMFGRKGMEYRVYDVEAPGGAYHEVFGLAAGVLRHCQTFDEAIAGLETKRRK